jgi:hypothetical protein
MHAEPTQAARLTRHHRDHLWSLAADDLAAVADGIHHDAMRRDLAGTREPAERLRAIAELLDAIGWDLHDPRGEYAVAVTDDLAPLLRRWRDQLDGVLRDQTPAAGELTDEDRAQIDADLDSRLVLDQLLAGEVVR